MAGVERIVFKRIYVGRAALFGLYYGIFIGLISAIIIFIMSIWSINTLQSSSVGDAAGLETAGATLIAFIFFILYVVITPIASIIFALIYNLIAKIGGALHFDLMEYERPSQEQQ